MPTDSGPNSSENSTYLEFVRALRGLVYQARRPELRSRRISSRAIQVLPLPVGAVTRTSSSSRAASASSWNGSGLKGEASGVPIPESRRCNSLGFVGTVFAGALRGPGAEPRVLVGFRWLFLSPRRFDMFAF